MISKRFKDVFGSGGAGIVVECTCGRVHYSTYYADVNCYGDGEFEELKNKTKKDQDKYIGHDHGIVTMHVNGYGDMVFGCSCGSFCNIEDLIKDNAVCIKKYLRQWANDLRDFAESVDPD